MGRMKGIPEMRYVPQYFCGVAALGFRESVSINPGHVVGQVDMYLPGLAGRDYWS